MSGEKRHQQATIFDDSGLRLGNPSPLLATQRGGIGKVVQVQSSLMCTNVSTHTTFRRQGRSSLMAAGDGYLSVYDRDEECRNGDPCDRLLCASDESLPLREIGPKDKAVNNYSQTTAEILRCILMSSEKRHQQATILEGSDLQLGRPSPLLATRRVGIGKVVQVRSSLLCTNVSRHDTVPRRGQSPVIAAA